MEITHLDYTKHSDRIITTLRKLTGTKKAIQYSASVCVPGQPSISQWHDTREQAQCWIEARTSAIRASVYTSLDS